MDASCADSEVHGSDAKVSERKAKLESRFKWQNSLHENRASLDAIKNGKLNCSSAILSSDDDFFAEQKPRKISVFEDDCALKAGGELAFAAADKYMASPTTWVVQIKVMDSTVAIASQVPMANGPLFQDYARKNPRGNCRPRLGKAESPKNKSN
ncbi:hypothetical protein ACLOJK_032348 [Asimina triloba]